MNILYQSSRGEELIAEIYDADNNVKLGEIKHTKSFMITTAKGKDMKTQIGIGHDVINDYNIGCLCCGRKDIQLHHYPSKGAMKGIVLSEILYVTIFPLCEVHHAEAHLGRVTVTEYLGGIRSGEAVMRVMRWEDFVESDLMKSRSKEITVREATIEHVKRIIAQNAKPSTE